MRFSGQEYWSGLPFPSPGDLPDLGIKTRSPALQTDLFFQIIHSLLQMINLQIIGSIKPNIPQRWEFKIELAQNVNRGNAGGKGEKGPEKCMADEENSCEEIRGNCQ